MSAYRDAVCVVEIKINVEQDRSRTWKRVTGNFKVPINVTSFDVANVLAEAKGQCKDPIKARNV